MYPEEVLRHRGTKEGVATSEAWLPCLGMDLLQVCFTSHMDWNFRTNSAIVFFSQVFVRSRVTLTWCRGATMVFAIKSLRLFNLINQKQVWLHVVYLRCPFLCVCFFFFSGVFQEIIKPRNDTSFTGGKPLYYRPFEKEICRVKERIY